MHIRTIFLLLIAAGAAMLSGCAEAGGSGAAASLDPVQRVCDGLDEKAHKALTGQRYHTLVFADASSSTGSNVREALSGILDLRIVEALSVQNSRLQLALIHSRTTGSFGTRDYAQNVPLPEEKSFDTEQIRACQNYSGAVEAFLIETRKSSGAFLDSVRINKENKQGTDLWGVLEVASRAFQRSPEGSVREVYIVSDLLECMAGPDRRCMEQVPPRDRQEAEAWARTDAETIQRLLEVRPDRLRDATYHLVSSPFGLREKTTTMPYYWKALLGALGVPEERIQFE